MYEYPDQELIYLVSENDDDAFSMLFNKYEYLVGNTINRYTFIIEKLKLDKQEIYQECLIAYAKAIKSFDESGKASFKTYVISIINRRIIDIIRKKTSKSNPDISIVNLEDILTEENLIDKIEDKRVNVESEIIRNDLLQNMKTLSKLEKKILSYLVVGCTSKEIGRALDMDIKHVNNAIYRIRTKLKNDN